MPTTMPATHEQEREPDDVYVVNFDTFIDAMTMDLRGASPSDEPESVKLLCFMVGNELTGTGQTKEQENNAVMIAASHLRRDALLDSPDLQPLDWNGMNALLSSGAGRAALHDWASKQVFAFGSSMVEISRIPDVVCKPHRKEGAIAPKAHKGEQQAFPG